MKESGNEEKKKETEAVEPLVNQLQQSMHRINTYLSCSEPGSDFVKFMADPQQSQIKYVIIFSNSGK